MSEHDTIQDPFIHEPKGVSSADAGQIYVADGAGSGSWLDADVANPHNTIAYADKNLTSGEPPQGITVVAAGDSTLRTLDDFVHFTDDMSLSSANGITIDANGNFVIETKGLYQFNFWFSESNTISDGELGITLYKNQADPLNLTGPVVGQVMRDKTKTSTDINSLAISGVILLDVSDVVGIAAASDKPGTITFTDASFSLILLEDIA